MKWIRSSLALACLAPAASPQDPQEKFQRFQIERDMIWRELDDMQNPPRAEESERAKSVERQFLDRASRFVRAWDGFVDAYNHSKVFDLKKAREVMKAFRELEKSEGWLLHESK